MIENVAFPLPFYIGLLILFFSFAYAWSKRSAGVGIPLAAVLGTVGLWYFGDSLYNDYQQYG